MHLKHPDPLKINAIKNCPILSLVVPFAEMIKIFRVHSNLSLSRIIISVSNFF